MSDIVRLHSGLCQEVGRKGGAPNVFPLGRGAVTIVKR